MRKAVSAGMIVIGVGLLVLGFSDYTPASAENLGGWSESCRYVMTFGSMLAVGGWQMPR